MKRRLFLSGPIGCGKSTAIAAAVGDSLPSFGGFLTRRQRDEQGHAITFSLASPDGNREQIFLDCSHGYPSITMDIFKDLAPKLMHGDLLILDEIGGMELLQPEFMSALYAVLESDIPIIGVLKGEAAASAMIRRLGLTEAYEVALRDLHKRLAEDENTQIYHCGQHDSQALALCQEWVKEFVRD